MVSLGLPSRKDLAAKDRSSRSSMTDPWHGSIAGDCWKMGKMMYLKWNVHLSDREPQREVTLQEHDSAKAGWSAFRSIRTLVMNSITCS